MIRIKIIKQKMNQTDFLNLNRISLCISLSITSACVSLKWSSPVHISEKSTEKILPWVKKRVRSCRSIALPVLKKRLDVGCNSWSDHALDTPGCWELPRVQLEFLSYNLDMFIYVSYICFEVNIYPFAVHQMLLPVWRAAHHSSHSSRFTVKVRC